MLEGRESGPSRSCCMPPVTPQALTVQAFRCGAARPALTLISNQLREGEAYDRVGVHDVLRTTRKKSKRYKAEVAAAVEQQTTVVLNSFGRRHHRHKHHQHAHPSAPTCSLLPPLDPFPAADEGLGQQLRELLRHLQAGLELGVSLVPGRGVEVHS